MILRKASLWMAVGSALLLTSCLKVGTNVGSNVLTLNASILKGRLSRAHVQVFDAQGNWVWEGLADENGNVDIELRSSVQGELQIQVSPSIDSTMLCDASECVSPSGERVAFNEPFDLGGEAIALSSSVHTGALNADATPVQVSGLSQLSNRWLRLTAPEEYKTSAALHARYAQLASKLITASLGVELPPDINLLATQLADLNSSTSLDQQGANMSLLSLINASLSSDIQVVEGFSDTLERLAQDPNNPSIQAEFETVQKRILKETQKLATLPGLTGVDVGVIEQIDSAANLPLDFSEINQAISESQTGNVTPIEPGTPRLEAVTSSSSHWLPTATNLRDNAWWWVSRSDTSSNEWIRLDFTAPIAPSHMLFAIDRDRRGNNLILQGRNVGDAVWTQVALNLSDYALAHGETDIKNVQHTRYEFTDAQRNLGAFQSYRLVSSPSNSLWLEYLCLGHFTDAQNCFSGVGESPETVTVSSLWFGANNVTTAQDSWISRMASGQQEWLQIRYSEPVQVTELALTAKAEFLGALPALQGQDEEGNWHTVLSINTPQLQTQADENGLIDVILPVSVPQAYRAYRYHSQATTFVWIQALNLTF